MGSAAAIHFHLPSAYFPKVNNKICSKLSFPRISWCRKIASPTPLRALAIDHHHQLGQNDDEEYYETETEDEDEDDEEYYETEDHEEIESPLDKLKKELYSRLEYLEWKNLVFWDMDTTPLPRPADAPQILRDFKRCLSYRCLTAPVELLAYGDKNKMSSALWDQLQKSRGEYSGDKDAFIYVATPEGDSFKCFIYEGGGIATCDDILIDLAISTLDYPNTNRIVISGNNRIKKGVVPYLRDFGYQVFSVLPSSSVEEVFAHGTWTWEDFMVDDPSL